MDYEAAAQDRYETDSFCVDDDESLVEHVSEGDALDHFEETEDTMRIGAERMTRLKKGTKRSRCGVLQDHYRVSHLLVHLCWVDFHFENDGTFKSKSTYSRCTLIGHPVM